MTTARDLLRRSVDTIKGSKEVQALLVEELIKKRNLPLTRENILRVLQEIKEEEDRKNKDKNSLSS